MKNNLPTSIILLFIFVAGVFVYFVFKSRLNSVPPANSRGQNQGAAPASKPNVKIGQAEFSVDIADTGALREQGLSGRASLPENSGMFFVFPSLGNYGFWMKDMNFPIDIVWIKGDTVAGFSENTKPQPGTSILFLKIYYPPARIDKVLEINAGLVKKLGLKIGDSVSLMEN